ncbi:FtsK/SpoIIIE domain-containing protein [Mycobacteroides abscessus subsp. massiliense]|uniref:FtsK/SpoIIIE domain-containing protein n=1 Tax=Mycobacteroides abscessus TaxID=36809 RepID=UPI0019D0F085|nr:FtsK/SpoIIIE domain-containing protein [Mycobacteroides abscessus]MBN7567182.1 hypothetical protein [Mycobacteroides abscessus subsp. massiliense]
MTSTENRAGGPAQLGQTGSEQNEKELPFYAEADWMSPDAFARFAREMAALRDGGDKAVDTQASTQGGRTLLDVLGIEDAAVLDTERLWKDRWQHGPKFWKIPVGIDDDGNVMEMDFKQSADHGWNINGVIIGDMGSGKSVSIADIVKALLLTHPPESCLVALFDLKAKSIAQRLENSPNVIASVSNLGAERHRIRRMHLAIAGEIERRKEACEAADCVDLNEYHAKIAAGADLPRIPALNVIVDEFNELPAVYPQIFKELFDPLVRQGRAYWISLLLVGQRYDSNLLKDLDPLWGFKIALKCGSPQTSRAVIGEPLAYQLPARGAEGVAYVRVGSDPLRKFRFFNAFEDYVPPAEDVSTEQVRADVKYFEPREFTAVKAEDIDGLMDPPPQVVQKAPAPKLELAAGQLAPTQLDTVISAAAKIRKNAKPVIDFWLPELHDKPGLRADELVSLMRGGHPWYEDYGVNPGLSLPVGQEDRAFECSQPVLAMDLATRSYSITGENYAELTDAMMTAMIGGSLLYAPSHVEYYCIAGGGADLMLLNKLPHVQGMATQADQEGVARVLDSVIEIIDNRAVKFVELGINTRVLAERRAADPNAFPEIGGAVNAVLFVDGFINLKAALNDDRNPWFIPKLTKIVNEGPANGVRVVISSTVAGHMFNPAIQDQLKGHIEFKLNIPTSSKIDRKENMDMPDWPGMGLAPTKHPFRLGVPAIVGVDNTTVVSASGDLAAVLAERAGVQRAAEMARLPEKVTLDELTSKPGAEGKVVVGLREKDLMPLFWDLQRSPHYAVLGGPGMGKTTTLHALCQALSKVFTPDEAEFHFIDLRRSMFGALPPEYIKSHAISTSHARHQVLELVDLLRARKPDVVQAHTGVAPARNWQGKDIFVVVDNAHMLSHSAPDWPFHPERPNERPAAPPPPGTMPKPMSTDTLYGLAELGAEVGLHIIYSATLNEFYPSLAGQNAVFRTLKNMFSPTLVLGGDRNIGIVAASGVRPKPQRPGRGTWVAQDSPLTVLAPWTGTVPADGI